jgi:ankyrin repeat protein
MGSELFAAIKDDDRRAVDRLIDADRAVVDARDEAGLSPLLAALYRGRSEIASAILARGPTLTVFEASAAGVLDRVRALVDSDPALANASAPDGYSPLGLAAFFKHREVVRYLLTRGADSRAPSRDQGFTPLHSAVATDAGARDIEIVRLLLAAGADPNAKSRQGGGTPLHTAAFTGDRAVVELLLAHGADPRAKTSGGKRPADLATERGHTAVAGLLEKR